MTANETYRHGTQMPTWVSSGLFSINILSVQYKLPTSSPGRFSLALGAGREKSPQSQGKAPWERGCTIYNLRDSENKLNVRLPPTNYFKKVLVMVWHYTVQYPSLQGMVHITVPSSRSNAPSVKLLKARYSRKAAF